MNKPHNREKSVRGHVLVVDDEEKNCRLMRDLLSAHGYRVSEASNGEDALRFVGENPPDVILLDIMMPKLDGLEVCRRLQAGEQTAPIPILLVSALNDRADRLKGIAAGATDFITKPIDIAEVLIRVCNALRTKRLYDQRNELLHMRENLADMIVHDIRNPLLAITVCAKRISKPDAPPGVSRLADLILDQAQLIERLMDDLLAVSKMEQGHLLLQRTPEDLVGLGRAAFRNQQLLADTKNIRLELVPPDGYCTCEVDKNLFARLLDNLISNAVKFAPDNTQVTLRIGQSKESATAFRIQIEDEGPGIPLEHREAVFDKYIIVKQENSTSLQTGIGLALCRLVAEAHGGRIFAEARQPTGSIFTVELPSTAAAGRE